jgi:glycosyltransferase involved in cell wall biosynthesis
MIDECLPLVSVVVICRNEEGFIRACLESVLSWECPGYRLEILVVDGCSTDRTRQIVQQLAARDTRVRLLDNAEGIKPAGLNIGLRAARGEWIVRLDAHSTYPPDYLAVCMETAGRTGADNVGGVCVTQPRGNSVQARLVQALTTHRFGVGDAGFRTGAAEGTADTVPYGCYRRQVFDKIGYFDERLIHSQD